MYLVAKHFRSGRIFNQHSIIARLLLDVSAENFEIGQYWMKTHEVMKS